MYLLAQRALGGGLKFRDSLYTLSILVVRTRNAVLSSVVDRHVCDPARFSRSFRGRMRSVSDTPFVAILLPSPQTYLSTANWFPPQTTTLILLETDDRQVLEGEVEWRGEIQERRWRRTRFEPLLSN